MIIPDQSNEGKIRGKPTVLGSSIRYQNNRRCCKMKYFLWVFLLLLLFMYVIWGSEAYLRGAFRTLKAFMIGLCAKLMYDKKPFIFS